MHCSFVTLDYPYNRLRISGVEIRIRQLGKRINLVKIHPHEFRRTMANQSNVKMSHRKYIS